MSEVTPSEPDSEQSSKSTNSNSNSATSERNAGRSNQPKMNFPAKLHLILSTPEFVDAICWLPHGRAWRVQQPERLEKEILPQFFQHQKAASFYRQVTGWGFNRISSGEDFNAYYHERFLRDAPDLCRTMKRPTRTELAERKQSLSKTPPNFYAMPQVSEDNNESLDISSCSQHTGLALDEYKNMLLKLMSTYSTRKKGMYLQLELNRLEKKRAAILEQLKEVGGSNSSSPVPSEISLQCAAREPQQSVPQQSVPLLLNNLQPAMPVDPLRLALLRLMQPPAQQTQSHAMSQMELIMQPQVLQSPSHAMSQMSEMELVKILLGTQLSGALGSEQLSFDRQVR